MRTIRSKRADARGENIRIMGMERENERGETRREKRKSAARVRAIWSTIHRAARAQSIPKYLRQIRAADNYYEPGVYALYVYVYIHAPSVYFAFEGRSGYPRAVAFARVDRATRQWRCTREQVWKSHPKINIEPRAFAHVHARRSSLIGELVTKKFCMQKAILSHLIGLLKKKTSWH